MGATDRNRSRSAASGGAASALPSAVLSGDFPELNEMLLRTEWEDGSSRVPASLSFFIHENAFKVCLSDRDAQLVTFLAGDTVDDLLLALEIGLAEDRLDWRPASGGGKRRRR